MELSLLQSHYHPVVAKFAKEVANGNNSIANELYMKPLSEILNSFDTSQGLFNPPIQPPPKHKLQGKTLETVSFIKSIIIQIFLLL